MKRFNRWLRAFLREWLGFFFFALLLFAGRSAIADWNRIPSGSMEPTLYVGDLVLVNRLAYDLKIPFTTKHIKEWSNPKVGDVVVFYKPGDGQRLVKRVIGAPGDRVSLKANVLYLNGKRIPYKLAKQSLSYPLPEEEQSEALIYNEKLESKSHKTMSLPYHAALRDVKDTQVPEGHYFMLGDNRDGSADSRYFGFVPRENILGRVEKVIVSWDKEHYYRPRATRTLQTVV